MEPPGRGGAGEQGDVLILPVPQSCQHLHTQLRAGPGQVTEPVFCGVSSPWEGCGHRQTGVNQGTSVGWTARPCFCCLEHRNLPFPLFPVEASVGRCCDHVLQGLCPDLYTFPWLEPDLPIWDILVILVPFPFPCCIWEEGAVALSSSRTRENSPVQSPT